MKLIIGSYALASYILYIVFVLLCDWFDLSCYLLQLPQETTTSRIIILMLISFLAYYLKNKIKVQKIHFTKQSIIIIGFIFCIGFIKGIIPDTSYDVVSYHIFNQMPGFVDNFHDNVAPGYFQMFGFRLPDRLFYYFRVVLGYRMGTILNTFIIILMYLQICTLLTEIFGDKLYSLRHVNNIFSIPFVYYLKKILMKEEFLALIVTLTYDVVLQFGTYYIDLLAIPVALEMLRIIIINNQKKINVFQAIYFSFLGGILICMKMTNVVYIVPFIVCYLYKYRTEITFPIFAKAVLLGILPVFVYLIYNYSITGNPVFPYYNKIFQSEYFPVSNWKDLRWGPQNLSDYIFWPLYVAFWPEYRQNDIANLWPYGFAGVLCSIIYFFRHKSSQEHSEIYYIFICSFFIWMITTGHIRYFIFGFILGSFLLVDFIIKMLQSKKRIHQNFSLVLVMLLAIGPVVFVETDVEGREWSWRTCTFNNYLLNSNYVFHDHKVHNYDTQEKIDAFLINNKPRGGFACLIDDKVPIIYNYYIHHYLSGDKSEALQEKVNCLLKDKNVYDIYFPKEDDFKEYMESCDQLGVKPIKLEWVPIYFVNDEKIALVKMNKLNNDEKNHYYFAGINGMDCFTVLRDDRNLNIEVFGGLINSFGWPNMDKNLNLLVSITDANNHMTTQKYPIREGEFYTFKINQELEQFSNKICIQFSIVDDKGTMREITPYKFVLMNPLVTNGHLLVD